MAADGFRKFLTPNSKSIFLNPCTEQEVMKYCQEVKSKKSHGSDEVSLCVMKGCIHLIASHVAAMINEMFVTGIFPSPLKLAKITPVYKSGNNKLFSNYRPISVLNAFSKLYEKAICSRLTSFLEKNRLLAKNQFGFRKAHSPWMAIDRLLEMVHSSWENGDNVIGIFIDIRKAFDCVDFDILLSKLEILGVRGVANSLMQSYLKGRKHCVSFKNANSSWRDVSCGVPQGSILGPLLFLVYINDICVASENFNSILFADDTTLLIKGKDVDAIIEKANAGLEDNNRWCICNKLCLNCDKSHWILFNKDKSRLHSKPISIGSAPIKEVSSVKFLGITIDSNLKWKSQLQSVANHLSNFTGVFAKLRRSVPLQTLKILYNSFVLSQLHYGLLLWGGSNLSMVSTAQNKLLRSTVSKTVKCHMDPLYSMMGTLKVSDLYTNELRKLAFAAKNNLLPDHLNKKLISNQVLPRTRSEANGDLLVDEALPSKSLWHQAAKTWNEMDKNLKLKQVSKATFASNSKSDILQHYKDFACDNSDCFVCDEVPLLHAVMPLTRIGPHLFDEV